MKSLNKGKVWLVGAGPGDIGLLTLKGRDVIKSADTIVFDSLIGPAILSLIPEKTKLINVGKRASNHTMSQEDINKTLVKEAKKGGNIVRLKGGDPFLFGRGGEEIKYLRENNIPFEEIPGVTSSIAVPAYNGVPVTHRDYASSVHIITGHRKKGEEYDIDFKSLVNINGTLVFLMGVSALSSIMKSLINAGMDKDMPAGIFQKGCTGRQKKIVATISTLENEVKKYGILTPAIIVVGKVCLLNDEISWYEKLPLFGKKIIITRPESSDTKLNDKLRELGAEVIPIPTIKTVPYEENKRIYKSLENIEKYSWIIFTSPFGAKNFFKEMKNKKLDIRMLSSIKFAVTGEGTAKVLENIGIIPDFLPSVYDGEHLGKELVKMLSKDDKILIPRAEKGGMELIEWLSKSGAYIDDIGTYKTEYVKSEIFDYKKLFADGIDTVVFTSSSTVKGFMKNMDGIDNKSFKAACIGKQTENTAKEFGMKTYRANKATIESLLKLVINLNS